jgi:hypothetical protein
LLIRNAAGRSWIGYRLGRGARRSAQLIASQLYQTSRDNPPLLAGTMSILRTAALFARVFPGP